MKKARKIFLVSLLLSASVLTCGCEVTIKSEDDEYKEKYETLVSEIQNKYDHDQVKTMAKEIYTCFAVYLTEHCINDEPVPANTTYDDILDSLVNDCGLPVAYKSYDLDVSWKFNYEAYSIQEVTVTVDGITETYY